MATAFPSGTRAYRALWRWHFYAGLIVAPFLLILSVTGAIYQSCAAVPRCMSPIRGPSATP